MAIVPTRVQLELSFLMIWSLVKNVTLHVLSAVSRPLIAQNARELSGTTITV